MDREVRRAWRTDSIRSVDGAVRSAWDVIREAERLVRNDDVLGLKDLLNSLEPQWARVTTFLQLSIEATEETRDDGCWQDDNSRDMSLLEHATASGAFEVLRYLMSPWSNLEDAPRSRTILHRAVQRGHLEMMTFLVRDKDADLDLILESGDWELSPLAVAIESGDINIVKHLLDLGCNLQANCDDRSSPAVSFALREGSQDIAQWLIDQGASATNPDSEGRTPLHYAARAGALSLMRALLRLGADIDAGDKPYLETPLCVAAQYGQVDAMRFLLEAGAKAERISGQCPGSPVYAVYSGFLRCGSSALDLLVAWKVDLDRMYEDKSQMCTVLSWICRYSGSRSDGIGYLVGAGADINLGDRPPVLEAWQHGTVETVEFLLRSGAEYESLHLEKVPVEDPSWDPGRGHKKVLILQAWKEARTQAGSFSG
ncbi:unnamed protein product [Cercospora beticola]|nr:unnamed protein product [Cercospora beticola]